MPNRYLLKRYEDPVCSLARFLFGRPLGGRKSLQTFVRNRLSALDREAVGTGGKAGLGPLDGGELFAQIVRETFVELVLIEVGGQVSRIGYVRRLAGVLVREFREKPLDSRTF